MGPGNHSNTCRMECSPRSFKDTRKRFWISLVLTLPILGLSPLLQKLVGRREVIRYSGDLYLLFTFSPAVF